jgi:ribonuclease HII
MEKETTLLLGIDDAGRGPVIGPMALAGVLIRLETEKELKDQGIADSKLLTSKKRESVVDFIKSKALGWKVQLISPIEIDTGFGEGLNLNQVEALVSANIINELTARLSTAQKENLKIILDCPSINTNGWKNQLLEYVKEKNLNIHCEHKADFNHVVVSAASIIAKVTRDAEIEKIKKQIGVDFGSGYPSDPYTKAFLQKEANNPKFKGIFRESWSTWREAAGNRLDNHEKEMLKGKQKTLF